jgi:DNA-directed RNA polymerase subunit RPC12/RpoP
MSIEAMKLALEALERLKAYGNVFRFRQDEQNPYDQACEAIAILRTAIEQAEKQEPVAFRYCCHSCFKANGGMMLDRMILCPECGNKRCPKASDHNFSCTGSNEPGQLGSIYTTPLNPVDSIKSSKTLDAQPQRERVIFPTMLRKMWSGGEVQAWLDENVNKEKNT